jgi:hypothetical protein
MKKRTILSIFVLSGLLFMQPLKGLSQEFDFDDFWTFSSQKLAYYDSLMVANNGDMKGTGYTNFMRWHHFWREPVFNDGSYSNTLLAMHGKYSQMLNDSPELLNTINVNWEELGPITNPDDQLWTNPPISYTYYGKIKGTGRCYFIEYDPRDSTRMFTGSPTGGLFYSTDGGDNWNNAGTDFLPNPGIAHMQVSPINSDIWYIVTGEGHGYSNFSFSYGVFRTMDQGQTWESISYMLPIPPLNEKWRNHSRKILIDPANGNRLFAVYHTGIYKTENALAPAQDVIWTLVQSGYFMDIQIKPGDSQVMYASGESIFWSQNAGNTWSEIPNLTQITMPPETDNSVIIIRVTPANPNALYATVIKNKELGYYEKIYKWDFITQQWNVGYSLTGVGMDVGRLAQAVSPFEEDIILYSQISNVYKSNNSGANWSSLAAGHHDDKHWINFGENENIIRIATDGGINKSEDGGISWINKTNNIGVANMFNLGSGKINPNLILYGGYDTGTSLCDTEEDEWHQLPMFGDSFGCGIDDTDRKEPPVLYWTNQNNNWFFNRSIDGGHTCDVITPDTSTGIGAIGWEQTFAMDYYNRSTLYLPGRLRIGRTTDRGDSWQAISPLAKTAEHPNRMWFKVWNSINYPDYLYAIRINSLWQDYDYEAFRLFKSVNCTATDPLSVTWIDVTPVVNNVLQERWIRDVAVDEMDPDKLWVCYSGYTNDDPKVIYFDGNEWNDLTGGPSSPLNGLSVLSIEHQLGSESNLVYIGTNAGVFYRSDDQPEWTKLHGIPHAQVMELEISYCAGKLRAATFGRGLWETDLIGGFYQVLVDNDETWNNHKLIMSNVIIPEGVTLTITGTVELSENSKIIIERGGKLFLDGGTLTSACAGMWQGIEVWGDPTLPSYEIYQGAVYILNGGTIENAVLGIRTVKTLQAGDGEELVEYNYAGGIVKSVNGRFINNQAAVRFYKYPATGYSHVNTSFFSGTLFETNEDYFGATNPGPFAYLDNINMVKFNVCEFVNNLGTSNQQTGLYSLNSQFLVNGFESGNNLQYTLFKDLWYGIYATANNPSRFADIRLTKFDLCHRGLYISGMTNARVTSNQFNTNATYKPLPLGGYGMYLNNSTGYWVEDNDYYHEGPTQVGIGIIVHNSGAVPNEIYNNRFTNLTMGVSAQENNGNMFTTAGLQILCNDFVQCAADILVPRPSTYGWGIAGNQGANSLDPTHMAGNLFHIPSPVPNGDFDDINNQGRHMNYYYPSNFAPGYSRVKPVDYTQNSVTIHGKNVTDIWTPETGCPSGIETGGGGEDPRTLMAESQQKIDSTETLLTMLVDGGNTQSLQTEVEQSFPPEAMAIYTELIDKSPYLSDTVVSTAIGKENVLIDAMIRDVMVANPHSAKNEQLLNKLDDRWTPLPDYMVEQILQGRNLISVKEKTESQLARFMLDKTRAMSRLERTYRSDTANMQSSLDSLAMLYATDHTPESKYRLAFLQLERGEAVQGQATLNAIPVQFTLRPGQVDEHAKLVEYYNLLVTFAGSAPDSAAVQALYGLSQHEPYHAAMYATNMLIALGEVQYEEPVIMPDYLKSARASGSQPGVDKTRKPQMLKVKPNPAKDFIIVEYELETGGNILIEVTDVSGKPVHSMQAINARDEVTVDTRHWKPGAHIVTLKLNGKPVESVKFTITQ